MTNSQKETLNPTRHSTEPMLQEAFTDIPMDNTSATPTLLEDIIKSSAPENTDSSSIASASTLGFTDTIAPNQTSTTTMFNPRDWAEKMLTTLSSYFSPVTPSIEGDQKASQEPTDGFWTSNITSVTSATPASDTDQIITDTVYANTIDINTTLMSDISETVTPSVDSLPTTTISNIMKNITQSIVDNVTDITTTDSQYNDELYYDNDDILIYVILGIVIALLIVIIIISYVFYKKCKSGYSKSGDYYITQYTTGTN